MFLFIIKDVIKGIDERPDEEVHKARPGRVLRTGAFFLIKLFTNLSSLQTPSFWVFMAVHYVGMNG